ncbi:polysaccharide deacetylase family protein [Rossellomorea sp. AcN35-11]|nr:polysaccharide deacetylase family protein [Rossellomorea aquimaris]WJV30887.1 polysaccharide deacetylase family protein [Rossellomorea sp. AcN35-11]
MKQLMIKSAVAFGFLSLVSLIFLGFGFFINKYDLLAKEYKGAYPEDKELTIGACIKGSEQKVRTFSMEGEPAKSIPILTYHRIIKEKDLTKRHYIKGKINPMIVTTENFRKQMDYLEKNGFTTLTLSELYAFLTNDLDIPDKSVVLTFDDGYKDNYIEAYPILKERGFKAANFIITGAISNRLQTYTPKYVQYFSTKELSAACDVFHFESHTYDLHKREKKDKTAYLLSKSDEKVKEDLQTSIFHLNDENLAFAYPYGEYSPNTIATLKELGFKMAFTTEEDIATPASHLYEVPRFQIFYSVSMKKFKDYVNQ